MKSSKKLQEFKNKIANVTAILIIIGIILGVIALTAFFGSSIMIFFGFRYTSIWSLLLFFLIYGIIEFPIGLFSNNLPKVLKSYNIISNKQLPIIQIITNTISTTTIMVIIDEFMKSVYAPFQAILIFSFVMALFDLYFDKK